MCPCDEIATLNVPDKSYAADAMLGVAILVKTPIERQAATHACAILRIAADPLKTTDPWGERAGLEPSISGGVSGALRLCYSRAHAC